MDIISEKAMSFQKVVQAISGRKIVAGAKQLRKALISGTVGCVYLAQNADPAITEPILLLCQLHNVKVAWVRSMTDLGQVCGIEVGATAAAVVDPI